MPPRNYVKEAREEFVIPPAPEEYDFDTRPEYLAARVAHNALREKQAALRERWIEKEKVADKAREVELLRLELERKRKEQEAADRKLEEAAKRKAATVVEVLIDGRRGCDLCLRTSEFRDSFVIPRLMHVIRGGGVLSCRPWS